MTSGESPPRQAPRGMTVAIDGPAGSGKSTVAVELARRLGLPHLDTGAMYRALALRLIESGVPPDDEDSIVALASKTAIRVDGGRTWTDGEEVTARLRSPDVDAAASRVAALPGVRAVMVAKQREFARSAGGVLEGRDIGTVVLPDADVKIFLTATPEERARRRASQMGEGAAGAGAGRILSAMAARDRMDSTRTASPLRVAGGAFILDSTEMSVEEVLVEIEALCRGVAAGGLPPSPPG